MITFNDTYFGNVEVKVVPFKTTRSGAKVTRYRLVAVNGECISIPTRNSYPTEQAALAMATRHPLFDVVRKPLYEQGGLTDDMFVHCS